MANLNLVHPYIVVIHASSDFNIALSHFQCTLGINNSIRYNIVDIFGVFASSLLSILKCAGLKAMRIQRAVDDIIRLQKVCVTFVFN